MPDVPRWLLVVILALCVIAMLAWARGEQHPHGQYVGAWGEHQSAGPERSPR